MIVAHPRENNSRTEISLKLLCYCLSFCFSLCSTFDIVPEIQLLFAHVYIYWNVHEPNWQVCRYCFLANITLTTIALFLNSHASIANSYSSGNYLLTCCCCGHAAKIYCSVLLASSHYTLSLCGRMGRIVNFFYYSTPDPMSHSEWSQENNTVDSFFSTFG